MAIQKEMPNDLPAFTARHEILKVIGSGLKPAAFYDKYFSRSNPLAYINLPGCSPANARYSLQQLTVRWQNLFSALP